MTLLKNKTMLACALALAFDASHAATPGCIDLRSKHGAGQRFELVRGKSVLKRFCSPASQVTVGAPEVANIVVPNSREVVIVPRSVGTTNLIVSTRDGHSAVFDLAVAVDTAALQEQFATLFPREKDVRIGSAGNALILSGMVADAVVASHMVALATAFQENSVQMAAPGGSTSAKSASPLAALGAAAPAAPQAAPAVLNMLSIAAPQQVLLEVKIAEVSKSIVDQFGARVGFLKNNGSFTYSILSSFLAGTDSSFNGVQPRVDAVKQLGIDGEHRDGLVKILAEPTVMAVSGQEASFLAGGKIFIPVAQNPALGTNIITLEEKEYGIAVKFTPTVLAGGRINLRVAPEVSELNREGIGIRLNGSTNATALLPAFTTRRASTTVQLQDGQSFAIGGLIRNNVTSNIKRFPFLGEVPVLGTLFRSSDFQNDRTELVFIVTPRLAKPLPDAPRLPTDDYVQPSRAEFLLGGRHEGSSQPAASKENP